VVGDSLPVTNRSSDTDDPDNLALYDVNTIANYDPDIANFIESPAGSAFARDATGFFVPVSVDEAANHSYMDSPSTARG